MTLTSSSSIGSGGGGLRAGISCAKIAKGKITQIKTVNFMTRKLSDFTQRKQKVN